MRSNTLSSFAEMMDLRPSTSSQGQIRASALGVSVFDIDMNGWRPLDAFGEDDDSAVINLVKAFQALPEGTILQSMSGLMSNFHSKAASGWNEVTHTSARQMARTPTV